MHRPGLRRSAIRFGSALAVAALLGASALPTLAKHEDKVGVCHHTGSATNPIVFIMVAPAAVPAHEAHGDTVGVKDASECQATPTPTPEPTPTPTPTPEPTPTPTPTPETTPTPTPTPLAIGLVSDIQSGTGAPPAEPWIAAAVLFGSVLLVWLRTFRKAS